MKVICNLIWRLRKMEIVWERVGFGRTVRLLPCDLGNEGSIGLSKYKGKAAYIDPQTCNRGSAIHWVCPLEIMSKLVFILYTVVTSQVCWLWYDNNSFDFWILACNCGYAIFFRWFFSFVYLSIFGMKFMSLWYLTLMGRWKSFFFALFSLLLQGIWINWIVHEIGK